MQIRVTGEGITITDRLRVHIDRRVRFALGRFLTRIRDLHVVLGVADDSRGDFDKSCAISVHLVGLQEVSEQCLDTDPYSAVDNTVDRIERSVARHLDTALSLERGLPVPSVPKQKL